MSPIPKIKLDQFCGLSTDQNWQAWLYQHYIQLYRELMDHLKTSRGCGHNREKMVELTGKLQAQPGGLEALIGFLRSNFPAMLEYMAPTPGLPGAASPVAAAQVPFELKSPGLLTFPQRTILEHSNPAILQQNVQKFASDKVKYDFIIIDGKAYIEYVSASHSRIAGQIPIKNWLVTAFKLARGL